MPKVEVRQRASEERYRCAKCRAEVVGQSVHFLIDDRGRAVGSLCGACVKNGRWPVIVHISGRMPGSRLTRLGCPACEEPVRVGDGQCARCGRELDWEGLDMDITDEPA